MRRTDWSGWFMLRSAKSVVSFLTVLPVGRGTLEDAARGIFLFPAAGALIGLLAGSAGLGMSLFMDPLLAGVLVTASIAVLTGLHHMDGLADFADGLMARGGRERRLAAMKDASTGSAGTAGIALVLAGMVAALSGTSGTDLLLAVILAEVLAKFSMVLMAGIGSSASPGSATPFVLAAQKRQVAAAFVMTAVLMVILGQGTGLFMLGAAMAVTLVVIAIATRSFGGITGDVLGACNELVRVASLVVFVSV